VPPLPSGEVVDDNMLIGWNRSREARRAVSDAMRS
jgi:hypothetical protein